MPKRDFGHRPGPMGRTADMDQAKDLLLVVILYRKNVEELTYLSELSDVDVLLYDNSPHPQSVNPKFHYIHDPSNSGVSKGYNKGMDLARKLKKKYVLLLDQDTVFHQEILMEYLKMKKRYGEAVIYAPIVTGEGKIYSPFVEKWVRNMVQSEEEFQYSERYDLTDQSVINSGLMIPLAIVEKVGSFHEDIKLDFSDIYWIDQYKRKFKDLVLVPVQLKHSISGDEGYHKDRELRRFRYYCNGAKVFKRTASDPRRVGRLVLFRTLRLVMKYKTILPLTTVWKYYFGEAKA